MKERLIETHLRFYPTYLVGIKNYEQQLEHIMPTLTTAYGSENTGSDVRAISDKTSTFAIQRVEGRRAVGLRQEIERYRIITQSIENAMEQLHSQERHFVKLRYFDHLPMYEVRSKLGFSDEKSAYRLRRIVLDKLCISLNNLLTLK
jgi:DNA-directed RNA polymerase specialized sigma subunit